ncbi:thioredoxin domain-containing protein [Streptomyces cucumeris]|uniref:thioredoxin domain-containing protein n=1 Tax=Streptomyces cucumeris TaxID=2962890 RepID=UPI003EB8475D
MWPGQHGQQPPGGEPNPQHNGRHQSFPQPGTTPPGSPPPPPGPPPAQPPGFPPGPAAPPPGGGDGGWGTPPPPRDRQRRAALTAIIGVSAAAAVLAAVLVITDDEQHGGSQGNQDQAQPSLPVPGGGAPSGDAAGGSGSGSGSGSGGEDPGGDGGTGGSEGGSGPLVAPAHASGPRGTTVLIGEKGAKHTLDLYEDLRCPPCAQFEQKVGPTVRKDVEDGRYRASFHFATFLDRNLKGSGSRNALSALGAALNVSTDAFWDYKAALLSAKHHPEESTDSFAQDSFLLEVAEDVPALDDSAAFRTAVRKGTYDRWAKEVSAVFDRSGVNGAPALKLDGTALTGSGGNAPATAAEFTRAVNDQLRD